MPESLQTHTRYWQPGIDTKFGTFRWFDRMGGPWTQADIFDRPAWERPVGGTLESGGDPSEGGEIEGLPTVLGGLPSTLNIEPDPVNVYTIEAYDADGEQVVSGIASPFLSGATYETELNQASTLRFKVAIGAIDLATLTAAVSHRLWLRDRWGFVLGVFNIRSAAASDEEPGASFISIVAQDALAGLGREPVIQYETLDANGNPTSKSVATILTELFALQTQAEPLSVGTIDGPIASYEMAFSAQDTTILGAIRELQAALPKAIAGAFYVTTAWAFEWRLNIGTEGDTISDGIQSGLREISRDAQFNRIYLYGEGQDARTRLKLTDAGEGAEYIEDATSVSTYGVLPFFRVEPSITDANRLRDIAGRLLEEFKDPYVRYAFNVLDIAKADDPPVAQNDIYLGSRYTIDGLELTVQRIMVDLSNPLATEIEIGNRRESVDEVFARILRSLNPPFDVNDDGSRYPTVGRLFDSLDPKDTSPRLQYRNGDWFYRSAGGEYYMFYWDVDGNGVPNTALDGNLTRVARYIDLVGQASDDPPQPIDSAEGTAGTSELFMRSDAVIQGMPWRVAADKATLESAMENGEIGTTTGTLKRAYIKLNDAMICISHFEVPA